MLSTRLHPPTCQSCAKQCIPFHHAVYSTAHKRCLPASPALFASRLVNSTFSFRHAVCSAASPTVHSLSVMLSIRLHPPTCQSCAIRQSSCKQRIPFPSYCLFSGCTQTQHANHSCAIRQSYCKQRIPFHHAVYSAAHKHSTCKPVRRYSPTVL